MAAEAAVKKALVVAGCGKPVVVVVEVEVAMVAAAAVAVAVEGRLVGWFLVEMVLADVAAVAVVGLLHHQ